MPLPGNSFSAMAVSSIQDRTNEFRSVLTQVQKRQASSKIGAQRQSLLTDSQKAANGSANGETKPRRSEFARKAAEIGRGISGTMAKLEKLTQRKNPFHWRTLLKETRHLF
jgi:syntaxin 5